MRCETRIEMGECIPKKNVYIPFCKLCILDHSTVLRFLVVKRLIATNGYQLRISFLIFQTILFFFKSWLNSKFFSGNRRGHGRSGLSAEYATDDAYSRPRSTFHCNIQQLLIAIIQM